MALGELYSFDTSAFINGQRDQFPPDVVPRLWPKIAGLIEFGQVQSVDVVLHELKQKDDETATWCKAQHGLFVPLDLDIQQATRTVLKTCPKLIGVGSGRSGADPFVVALALARGGSVVTDETATGHPQRPKIPDACAAVGVRCMNLLAFIREQGWSFG
ncbi:MAG: hypothetical protein BGO38_11355 [Cellulomonas sp. 73-145]|uniref:DUF4411 family protein n=1 Tax=Cellulomonas sp. 73-145 TaxID=1895739 RepID=UPI00092BF377|nr:DUF4411 family protein [Cellulomonas sp. 73-145]OJV57377.1 MAG: hypothetical protein BGO38_11355 [Cellulomonas sp. 73-145]